MKYILFCLVLFATIAAIPGNLQAQTKVYFDYDGSGNRRLRTISLEKSATIAENMEEERSPVETELGEQEILIYPNPTKGLLRIDMPSLDNPGIILETYDSRGRLLVRKQAREIGNQLDLSPYPAGLYILVIRTNKEKQEWKIIKE